MRDHKASRRGAAGRNVVGVRELKTHAARILRRVREARASYILTHRGRAVGLILPVEPSPDQSLGAEDASVFVNAFNPTRRGPCREPGVADRNPAHR